MHIIESDDVRAQFSLDGARLTSLRFRGREVVVTSDPREDVWYGGFLMVPWAGVLPDRRIAVGDGSSLMPATWGELALHGVARALRFDAVGPRLRAELPADWPFSGGVTLEADTRANRLDLRITVHADEEMPATIGWHPWFVREMDGVPAEYAPPTGAQQRETDGYGNATGNWIEPLPAPWDDCFRSAEPAVLRWPGIGRLEISSDGGFVGLYDGQPGGIAVEPMDTPPGAPNTLIGRGESRTLAITLTWSDE